MSERQLPEIALTEEEVDEVLRSCNGRALLVGGQALAFWTQHYDIAPLGVLGANITSDADFLGSADVARELAEALKSKGWRYWRATMDDGTTQTAKLSKRVEGQGIKQIDFLGSLVGLDSERILRRAVTVHLGDGARLQVLHPLDVLESRLKNLAALPSKRNRQGIAQARLAIDVTRRFLEHLVREGNARLLLKAIEHVARIAQDKSLDAVFHEFELDPLVAGVCETRRSVRCRTVTGFYRTSAGAEVDLVLELPGKREPWAVEIKRGLSAVPGKGFHSACEDLNPKRAFLVHSGEDRYPVADGIEAIGLRAMMSLLADG